MLSEKGKKCPVKPSWPGELKRVGSGSVQILVALSEN